MAISFIDISLLISSLGTLYLYVKKMLMSVELKCLFAWYVNKHVSRDHFHWAFL